MSAIGIVVVGVSQPETKTKMNPLRRKIEDHLLKSAAHAVVIPLTDQFSKELRPKVLESETRWKELEVYSGFDFARYIVDGVIENHEHYFSEKQQRWNMLRHAKSYMIAEFDSTWRPDAPDAWSRRTAVVLLPGDAVTIKKDGSLGMRQEASLFLDSCFNFRDSWIKQRQVHPDLQDTVQQTQAWEKILDMVRLFEHTKRDIVVNWEAITRAPVDGQTVVFLVSKDGDYKYEMNRFVVERDNLDAVETMDSVAATLREKDPATLAAFVEIVAPNLPDHVRRRIHDSLNRALSDMAVSYSATFDPDNLDADNDDLAAWIDTLRDNSSFCVETLGHTKDTRVFVRLVGSSGQRSLRELFWDIVRPKFPDLRSRYANLGLRVQPRSMCGPADLMEYPHVFLGPDEHDYATVYMNGLGDSKDDQALRLLIQRALGLGATPDHDTSLEASSTNAGSSVQEPVDYQPPDEDIEFPEGASVGSS